MTTVSWPQCWVIIWGVHQGNGGDWDTLFNLYTVDTTFLKLQLPITPFQTGLSPSSRGLNSSFIGSKSSFLARNHRPQGLHMVISFLCLSFFTDKMLVLNNIISPFFFHVYRVQNGNVRGKKRHDPCPVYLPLPGNINRQLTQVNHPHGENLKGGMSTHGDSTRLSLTLGPLDGSSGAHVL